MGCLQCCHGCRTWKAVPAQAPHRGAARVAGPDPHGTAPPSPAPSRDHCLGRAPPPSPPRTPSPPRPPATPSPPLPPLLPAPPAFPVPPAPPAPPAPLGWPGPPGCPGSPGSPGCPGKLPPRPPRAGCAPTGRAMTNGRAARMGSNTWRLSMAVSPLVPRVLHSARVSGKACRRNMRCCWQHSCGGQSEVGPAFLVRTCHASKATFASSAICCNMGRARSSTGNAISR